MEEKTIPELEFERVSLQIIDAIANIKTNSIHEDIIKGNVMLMLCETLSSEKKLNDDIEILRDAHYEEISMRRFKK